jgi:hypothetical protein
MARSLKVCSYGATMRRVLHCGDPLSRSAYPRRLFKAKVRRQRCRICDIFIAKCAIDWKLHSSEQYPLLA